MTQQEPGVIGGTPASRRDVLGGSAAAALAAAIIPVAASAAQQPSGAPGASASAGDRLRTLLATPEPIVAPIVYDVASAKLGQFLGFKVIAIGGSAVSNGMYGMGDYGMATVSELIEFATRVAAAIEVPLIADADDGGGNPMNVYRAIQRYARAGVGAVLLEDLTGAKHVPNRPEATLVSVAGHVDKIRAAIEARGADGPCILARSDALSKNEPFDQVLKRVMAYAEAGAELIMVSGATPEQLQKAAEATGKAIFTVGGGSNTADVLAAHKVKIAAFAIEGFALGAAHQAMLTLQKSGSTGGALPQLAREVSAAIQDSARWTEISRKFNAQSKI